MIGDFLFLDDDLCLFCKEEVKENFSLCHSCLNKLDYVDNEFEILGHRARVLYFYNPFMASLIGDYKFNRNTSIYKVFGQMVFSYIKEKSMDNFDYILTTPSSKSVVNNRGFDHVRLICDFFIKNTHMTYLKNFKKLKIPRPNTNYQGRKGQKIWEILLFSKVIWLGKIFWFLMILLQVQTL